MEKKRSLSVTIIGITLAIWSSFILIFSIFCLQAPYISKERKLEIMSTKQWVNTNVSTVEQFDKRMLRWGKEFLLLTIPLLVGAIGILLLKNWARILLLVFWILQTLYLLVISILKSKISIVPLLISLFFLCFLTRPKIKEQFK